MGATPLKVVTNRFPQAGENQISEAPGVVFDPTIGEEGMETPPPNDSSLSPPVGGRLRSFRRDWQTNKCSSNVLNIIPMAHTAIPLKTKLGQISSDSIRIQGPSKRPSSGRLYPVSSVKERNRKGGKCKFYCVNTSYPMDNMLNRSAQTGPPNVRKRRPVFPPASRSSHCTRQVACRTSFLSRQADVIASFSFGACTA